MDDVNHTITRKIGSKTEWFKSSSHQLSHDLRTPLNNISGFAELLLMDKDLSPAHADYVRAILSGGETLEAAVISHLDHVEAMPPALPAWRIRKARFGAQPGLRARRRSGSPHNFQS